MSIMSFSPMRLLKVFGLILSLLVVSNHSFAGPKTLTIAANTTWAAAAWSPAGAPSAGDDVTITNNTATAYTLSSMPSISLNSLTINGTGAGSVTLSGSSAVVTISGNISGALTINNNLTLTSTSITLNNQLSATGSLAVGKPFNIGTNNFTWNTGGTFTNNAAASNLTASTGTINFTYAGG